ncbi:MAG: hypothetical protein HQM08_06835 [Candidatus Riflebacteria bacterium]|nr:hypothetical protein [Candidatus Riflebacteria bacterium]
MFSKNSYRLKHKESAFTLMEIIVVAVISILLLIPAYKIFRNSSETSLHGLQQIDLVMEGRRIIKQIRNDLLSACIILPLTNTQYSLMDFLQVSGGSATSMEGTTFTFLAFPSHGDLKQAVSEGSTTGYCIKCANEISYTLEATEPGNPFLTLNRQEKVNTRLGGGTQSRVLSKRINYFTIRPVEIQTTNGRNQWFFNITLQLAEQGNQNNQKSFQKNTLIQSRQSGIMIADFFDVVCPYFFSEIWNQTLTNRNWQTLIQGP